MVGGIFDVVVLRSFQRFLVSDSGQCLIFSQTIAGPISSAHNSCVAAFPLSALKDVHVLVASKVQARPSPQSQ